MFEKLFSKNKKHYLLKIGGMKCEHCSARLTSLLSKLPGVSDVKASVPEAAISFTATAPVDESEVKKVISDAGFELLDFSEN